MIKAVIIDDEKTSRETIKGLLKRYAKNVEVVGEADGYISGINKINLLRPDVIFLDIQMPDGSGFKLLEEIGEINFEVIFTTAHDQFAIKAIKYSALDYLLKPINPEELANAVDKLALKLKKGKDNTGVNFLLEAIKSPSSNIKRIVLSELEGMQIVEVDDIIRCEADGNYTKFFLINKRVILVSKILKEYDEILSEFNFIRPHKSHLINLKYIKSIIKIDGPIIEMTDGSQVPVARRKKDQILDMLSHL
jgi:two-component system, LytTR family, response regulator